MATWVWRVRLKAMKREAWLDLLHFFHLKPQKTFAKEKTFDLSPKMTAGVSVLIAYSVIQKQ